MKQKTHISNVLEGNDCKDRYDAEVKKILSDKTILSWILKYTTEEFASTPVSQIRECIEGKPEVGTHRVYPGHTAKQKPEAITGSDTVDKVPGEGQITYDIRFYAVMPDKKRIKLIINVEAQKDFNPGYDLVTRGVFYCTRMLSAQKDTEFASDEYDSMKKVYSIWICMEAPRSMEYTITSYKLGQKNVYGKAKKCFRYDLMEVVMVCLGREEAASRGNRLHGMLSTLLSEKLRPEEKEKILSDKYDIDTSKELEGGLRQMCNLSDLVEERGIKKGLEIGREEGREEGREKGKVETLFSLVCKKVEKNKSLAQIADELEESVDTILPLYNQAMQEKI